MPAYSLEEAAARLPEIIAGMANGETATLVRDGLPVAKIVALTPAPVRPRFGSAKGLLIHLADDFDVSASPETLPDAAETGAIAAANGRTGALNALDATHENPEEGTMKREERTA